MLTTTKDQHPHTVEVPLTMIFVIVSKTKWERKKLPISYNTQIVDVFEYRNVSTLDHFASIVNLVPSWTRSKRPTQSCLLFHNELCFYGHNSFEHLGSIGWTRSIRYHLLANISMRFDNILFKCINYTTHTQPLILLEHQPGTISGAPSFSDSLFFTYFKHSHSLPSVTVG